MENPEEMAKNIGEFCSWISKETGRYLTQEDRAELVRLAFIHGYFREFEPEQKQIHPYWKEPWKEPKIK